MTDRLLSAVTAAGATLRTDIRPGDIGELIRMHGTLYAEEHGYDVQFEAYVAKTFSGYRWPLGPRECLWLVEKTGRLRGAVALVEASPGEAQLRWLLLHPDLRGRGVGRALVEAAVSFSRAMGYAKIILWTEGSLEAATTLYVRSGFVRTETKTSNLWGAVRTEERYELRLE